MTTKKSFVMEKSRPKNLTEKLIREVKATPLLWDKYHDMYNNRCATDNEWGHLSTKMNHHKDFLRQKWKNLRDQFQKELKKVKTPVRDSIQAYIDNYSGKWIYFEQLLFLKDTIKIKAPQGIIEEVEIPDDDEIKEELIIFEEEPLIEFSDTYDPNSRCPLNEISPIDACETETVEGENSIGTRKRRASEDHQSGIRCKRFSLAEDTDQIDDDLSFFKSLIPFMRKLNPIRKLMVRNEIQNILLRENLCDKCNGHSC